MTTAATTTARTSRVKRRAAGAGAAAIGAGLLLGALALAPTADAAAQVNTLTLRLASDPGQVANVSGASTHNLAHVIQWPYSRASNERWEPEATSGGWFRLRSEHSGKCLNVEGGGNEEAAQVIQYTCGTGANEQWKFVHKGIGYQIEVKSSGKCLNVKGGVGQGRDLIQYTCTTHGVDNDVWLPVWENASN
ncbi:RICIN domain-containing protein [Streptomyces polygonati]|uniref:RICIN domain-containing protein n=1 Tax=Streptomyces polygonati TaxID=1617087 RepID=A0ABV8HNI8_9ACTN